MTALINQLNPSHVDFIKYLNTLKTRDENLESLVKDILLYTEENNLTELATRLRFRPIRITLHKSTKVKETNSNLIVHVSSVSFEDFGGVKSNSKIFFGDKLYINNKTYELTAFIEHLGSSGFGHYFCYRKFYNNLWINVNDSNVRLVDKSSVFQVAKPYMLFYRLIN